MDIIPTTSNAPLQNSIARNDAEKISSDFETFLKMLTVQLKNQDPLDPMDSADFSMQLATFSGVEQQVRTNDLLTALTQQADTQGLSQISGWIGMEALAATSADFSGEPLDIYVDAPNEADSAILIVKNDFGQEVERRQIEPKSGPISWTGITEDGQSVLSGSYSFHVESLAEGELISTEQAQVYSSVTEVKLDAGVMSVVLATGDTFNADAITGLRLPPGE